MQRKTLLIAVFLLAVLIVGVYALLVATQNISNTATIKTVNVSTWQDNACTIPLTSWNWGMMEPGTSSQKTMYVKNDGNVPMTLNMTTSSWNPSNASTYITVTWNREGAVVPVGSNVQANVTLTISPTISGIPSFTFTMTITGTG